MPAASSAPRAPASAPAPAQPVASAVNGRAHAAPQPSPPPPPSAPAPAPAEDATKPLAPAAPETVMGKYRHQYFQTATVRSMSCGRVSSP